MQLNKLFVVSIIAILSMVACNGGGSGGGSGGGGSTSPYTPPVGNTDLNNAKWVDTNLDTYIAQNLNGYYVQSLAKQNYHDNNYYVYLNQNPGTNGGGQINNFKSAVLKYSIDKKSWEDVTYNLNLLSDVNNSSYTSKVSIVSISGALYLLNQGNVYTLDTKTNTWSILGSFANGFSYTNGRLKLASDGSIYMVVSSNTSSGIKMYKISNNKLNDETIVPLKLLSVNNINVDVMNSDSWEVDGNITNVGQSNAQGYSIDGSSVVSLPNPNSRVNDFANDMAFTNSGEVCDKTTCYNLKLSPSGNKYNVSSNLNITSKGISSLSTSINNLDLTYAVINNDGNLQNYNCTGAYNSLKCTALGKSITFPDANLGTLKDVGGLDVQLGDKVNNLIGVFTASFLTTESTSFENLALLNDGVWTTAPSIKNMISSSYSLRGHPICPLNDTNMTYGLFSDNNFISSAPIKTPIGAVYILSNNSYKDLSLPAPSGYSFNEFSGFNDANGSDFKLSGNIVYNKDVGNSVLYVSFEDNATPAVKPAKLYYLDNIVIPCSQKLN